MSSSAQESDEELARRAAGGDRSAFDDLARRYRLRLVGFLKGRTPPGQDTDDLAQEVWAKVLAAMPRWADGHFRGWLFRIARHAAIDAGRRKTARQADDAVLLTVAAPDEPTHWTAELLPRLRRCLEALRTKKPGFHAAVVRQMAGEELAVIATEQGIPIDTVKTRIRRGKEALRGCVGEVNP